MRNAGHKARQAKLFAAAVTGDELLHAAWDWFRSSVSLLARRQVPPDASKEANREASARLKADMTAYLKSLAEAIDRGEYDTKKVTHRDNGQ